MKFNLHAEEEFDPIEVIEIEESGKLKSEIKQFEEATGAVVDFVYCESHGEWYTVDDNHDIELAESELAVALDEEYGDDVGDMISESGWFEELLLDETEEFSESTVRRVTSTGAVSRVKSRRTRQRQATRTTGLSKAQLRRRAKKAARTKKRDTAGQKRALKKRGKAMRRRRSMGI